MHASQVSLREKGKNDAAFMVNEIVKSPAHATKLRRLSGIADAMDTAPPKPIMLPSPISPETALSFILENNLTKEAYVNMRLISKLHNSDIWPLYDDVLKAKQECRPENISFSEMSIVVPISERVKQNDRRFLSLFDAEVNAHLDATNEPILEIEVESKVGFDGSTGLTMYNQAFSTENEDVSDSALLSTCLVPLQWRVKGGPVLFTNPVPQASSFCQPLRLEFRKETIEVSRELNSWIDDAARELTEDPPMVVRNEKTIKFLHIIRKTMMDNKVKNAITETASAVTCFVCGANPKEFNCLENFPTNFPTNEENLQFGAVCDFHAIPRSFDAINSVSDRLTVEKWRISKGTRKGKKSESTEEAEERKKEDARILEEVETRKRRRQAAFKSKMNLIVDVPRAGGSGNSNTGNVARRAFSDAKLFSEITGVDEELIFRLHVLHIVFNTDEEIDDVAVREYGRETAALWIRLYPWYPMPVSVHQLLIHGHEAIKLSSLPVSFLSEQS